MEKNGRCKYCNDSFDPKYGKMFCNSSCRNKWHRANHSRLIKEGRDALKVQKRAFMWLCSRAVISNSGIAKAEVKIYAPTLPKKIEEDPYVLRLINHSGIYLVKAMAGKETEARKKEMDMITSGLIDSANISQDYLDSSAGEQLSETPSRKAEGKYSPQTEG
jgi:hypothetical protein